MNLIILVTLISLMILIWSLTKLLADSRVSQQVAFNEDWLQQSAKASSFSVIIVINPGLGVIRVTRVINPGLGVVGSKLSQGIYIILGLLGARLQASGLQRGLAVINPELGVGH
jgi:hypothetical protein